MLIRKFFSAVFLAGLVVPGLSAPSGTINLRLTDAVTHYAVRATIKLEGRASLALETNAFGRVRRTVPLGEYRIEVSAPGYEVMRTHTNVTPETGRTGLFTLMLQPQNPPDEALPEVIASHLRVGYTLLHGYVVDAESGQPIAGVTVRLVNARAETQTDSRGHFWLSAPTPPPDVSGWPGTDTLIYEKRGYETLVLRNFDVGSDEIGPVATDMEKGTGIYEQDATHKLRRGSLASPQEPQSARPGARLSPELYRWLGTAGTAFSIGPETSVAPAQAITVPNSIRVGTGGPSKTKYEPCSTATTCTNSFTYSLEAYVSDGLPAEWPNWWDANARKAGAVAYRSYGGYYVANPLGANNPQPYDICNTTACQVYNPWGWPSNNTSRAAVSATAGVVLSRDGANIFKAEYAGESNLAEDIEWATCWDGQIGEPSYPVGGGAGPWPCMTDFVCTGKEQTSTHSRGMCQRGSQRWASGVDKTGPPGEVPGETGLPILNSAGVPITPRDWRCILNHYYNASSNSIRVDPNPGTGPGPGSGFRTAFLQGAKTYGSVAYEDYSTSPTSIRVASLEDGSDRLLTGSALNPSWSPDAGKLVYRSDTGLWIVNADGSGKTQITTNPSPYEYDFNPAWSPLGNKIAFCSTRTNAVDVWTVNPNGTGLARLTTGLFDYGMGSGPQPCYLSWSPDGTNIAFTGDTVTGPYLLYRYNVYTMTAGGLFVTQLTNCINSIAWQSVCINPSWFPDRTPDKAKIAFEDDDYQGDNIGGGGIYTIKPDGSTLTAVYRTSTTINEFPHWSTDGQRIIFLSNQSGKWAIWSMNTGGTGQVPIVGTANNYKYYPGQLDCSRCPPFDQ